MRLKMRCAVDDNLACPPAMDNCISGADDIEDLYHDCFDNMSAQDKDNCCTEFHLKEIQLMDS